MTIVNDVELDTVPADAERSPADLAVTMADLLAGYQRSQALYAVAKLDIPALLLDGPMTAADLAERTGADPTTLARLLHVLSGYGVFTHDAGDGIDTGAEETYAVTELGATLAPGTSGSVRGLAMMWMETHYRAFGEFLGTVRTGRSVTDLALGAPFFDTIADDPELVEHFNQAMADITTQIQAPVVEAYTLPPGEVVADVGGADGSVLAQLLADEPDRRGIVADLPHVVGAAHLTLDRHGLTDRVDVIGKDFFVEVPRADVYVLSKVLHDWDDAHCARILEQVRRSAGPGARLVVIDTVMADGDAHSFAKIHELNMLAVTSGRERTASEYTDLLAAAGFAVDAVYTGSEGGFSIVEATLVQSRDPDHVTVGH